MHATFKDIAKSDNPFIIEDFRSLRVGQIKEVINVWIYDKMNGVVQSGPFIGMKLSHQEIWRDGNLGTQILGCYEQELHRTIETEIRRLNLIALPAVVNVGCANGYYAVGMACRVPRATVFIIDTLEAMDVAQEAAAANGRVLISQAKLSRVFERPDLVICDCEGDEIHYLDPAIYPALIRSAIIVECHDFKDVHNTQILADRFYSTHAILEVRTGERNPAQFPFLQTWHQTLQWLAVDEGRPCSMRWLVMRPMATSQ